MTRTTVLVLLLAALTLYGLVRYARKHLDGKP